MADILPPAPINEPPKSYAWVDWYVKLRDLINRTAGGVAWSDIDFTGSSLSDLVTRLHNTLQGLQGGSAGEYNHLTNAQLATVTSARSNRGVDTTDDVIIDLATKGLVLKDTQGTPHYWRVTISNVGALVTTDLGTTKP